MAEKALRIGDKVKIIEHTNLKYIDKTGILLKAQTIRPAINRPAIREKYKVHLYRRKSVKRGKPVMDASLTPTRIEVER